MSSKSKEYVSTSESASESDDEPKQKKKKKVEEKPKSKPTNAKASDSKAVKGGTKKSATQSSNDDDETKFEIGKMRYATVCEFRGKKMVNIREFYQNDDGDLKPGKKGIALSVDQWNKLKENMDAIDEALDAM